MQDLSFRNYCQQFFSFSDEQWACSLAFFEQVQAPEAALLLAEGEVCKHFYFLEKGLVRYFVWDEGVDRTKYFSLAPQLFTSTDSFARQIAAEENLEAIEPCVLWRISREQMDLLYEQVPEWNTVIRKLLAQVTAATDTEMREAKYEAARDRYQALLVEEPELIQRVPLKHLATYLGIAPESLSRIRRQISQA
ncbi:MAG TPA: Crp/Fnr family transcriptional regulator [Cytophagales bacterium]|nr:Crp/Fnr family transcriptional regulator [Cytophagales bacterium]HAA23778.1 Crp/Fnr family transcriptional regulator [Cytophagales bacterium]HAP61183.1 Crp/Fnr family transcriptional regulator [Cytophagales bacterium]